MIRRPPSARLHGWLSYTLSRSERSYDGVVAASDWDQRHVVNLVTGYRVGRYTVGGRVHAQTGRPVRVQNGEAGEWRRLPPFYQLDLRAERRFVFDTSVLDLYVEFVNTTLTRQVVALERRGPDLRRQGFRLVLPSIGVRAEF
jgi:hypothetical protein